VASLLVGVAILYGAYRGLRWLDRNPMKTRGERPSARSGGKP